MEDINTFQFYEEDFSQQDNTSIQPSSPFYYSDNLFQFGQENMESFDYYGLGSPAENTGPNPYMPSMYPPRPSIQPMVPHTAPQRPFFYKQIRLERKYQKRNFDLFYDTLDKDTYTIDEILPLFNNFFNTNVSKKALGQITEFKEKFCKGRHLYNNKQITKKESLNKIFF